MNNKRVAQIAYELIQEKETGLILKNVVRKNKLESLLNEDKKKNSKETVDMYVNAVSFINDVEEEYKNIIYKYHDIIRSFINEKEK